MTGGSPSMPIQRIAPGFVAAIQERVHRRLGWFGLVLLALGVGLVSLGIINGQAGAQAAPPSVPDLPLTSLKTVPVKDPANLKDFVADRAVAIQLGKAFFWDVQMGSDGATACAGCHYQ